jgi:SAM-dependent methyltransferase
MEWSELTSFYGQDLAYIHAMAYGGLAKGAAPEILRLLKAAATPVRSVVDAGCGAGALAKILVEAGFDVTGIDGSAGLLALARTEAPRARFVHASIYDAELPACQAILAVGEPLTYHAEEAKAAKAEWLVQLFFERAAAVLPPGGMLIFDAIETGAPSLAGRSWSSGEDWAVLVETSEDQASRTLQRTIETFRRMDQLYRRGREIHHVHLFETDELMERLDQSGFAVRTAQAYGDYRLAPRRRAFFCTRRGSFIEPPPSGSRQT